MENSEQDGASQSPGKVNSAQSKKVLSKEKKNKEKEYVEGPGREDAIKAEQEKFISDTESTENLIDPGNEHRHHTDEFDKKIG